MIVTRIGAILVLGVVLAALTGEYLKYTESVVAEADFQQSVRYCLNSVVVAQVMTDGVLDHEYSDLMIAVNFELGMNTAKASRIQTLSSLFYCYHAEVNRVLQYKWVAKQPGFASLYKVYKGLPHTPVSPFKG
jgi:hypothetical protein